MWFPILQLMATLFALVLCFSCWVWVLDHEKRVSKLERDKQSR